MERCAHRRRRAQEDARLVDRGRDARRRREDRRQRALARRGLNQTLFVDRPLARIRKTLPHVEQLVDDVLETMTDKQIAVRLNELGHRNWRGDVFTTKKVILVRSTYGCTWTRPSRRRRPARAIRRPAPRSEWESPIAPYIEPQLDLF